MMSLGNLVCEGRNSSPPVSNLSASAPPFTVDRLNSKPSNDPPFHLSDSYFDVDTFNQGWQYPYPSAPRSELIMRSTALGNSSSPHEYQFSASASVAPSSTPWSCFPVTKASSVGLGYGIEARPSYSPCVQSIYGDHTMKLGDERFSYFEGGYSHPSVASQFSYAPSSFDLEWGHQPVDSFGFQDGKRTKRFEPDVVFSEGEENNGGSKNYRNHLHEAATYKLTEKSWGDSAFSYNEDMIRNSTAPYQKCDGYFSKDVCTSSGRGGNMDEKSGLEVNHSFIPYYFNMTRIQDSSSIYPQSGDEMGEKNGDCLTKDVNACDIDPYGTSRPECSLEQSGLNHLQAKDILGSDVRSRVSSQIPEFDFLGISSISGNNAEPVNAFEKTADFIDHQNLAVDSPCWRGASSSPFSLLDVESGSCNFVKKALDECVEYEHEKYQNGQHSASEPRLIFLGEAVEPFKTCKNGYAGSVTRLDDIHFQKENNSIQDGKADVHIATVPSGASRLSDIPDMLTSQMNDNLEFTSLESRNASGQDVSDSSLNDASDGGNLAVHAAQVLFSSVSQEIAPEHIKQQDSKLNVSTMIDALHNISELLLVHLSNDSGSLENEKNEVVEHIISNLKLCLSKKTPQATNKLDPGTSEAAGKSPVLNATGSPDTRKEATDLKLKRHKCDEDRDCISSRTKDMKSQYLTSLGDSDAEVTRDDNVAKNIKKVLEENFDSNEEINAQGLLFKSLWLEAEAKLCSMSYKVNFYKMKIQMKEMELKSPSENEGNAVVGVASIKPAGVCLLDPNAGSQNICFSDDAVESCAVVRFNVPKSALETGSSCDGKHPDSVLKSREDGENEKELREGGENQNRKGGHDSTIVLLQQTSTADDQRNKIQIHDEFGGHDSASSSEWEHVRNDPLSWST